MEGVVAFVTYLHRNGTTQQSAAIMVSLTSLSSKAPEFLSSAITVELQMRTIKAMTTNTNCQYIQGRRNLCRL